MNVQGCAYSQSSRSSPRSARYRPASKTTHPDRYMERAASSNRLGIREHGRVEFRSSITSTSLRGKAAYLLRACVTYRSSVSQPMDGKVAKPPSDEQKMVSVAGQLAQERTEQSASSSSASGICALHADAEIPVGASVFRPLRTCGHTFNKLMSVPRPFAHITLRNVIQVLYLPSESVRSWPESFASQSFRHQCPTMDPCPV